AEGVGRAGRAIIAVGGSHAAVAGGATREAIAVTDSVRLTFVLTTKVFVPIRLGDTTGQLPHEGGGSNDMLHPAMPSPTDTCWKRALRSVLKFTRPQAPAQTLDDERRVMALRTICLALVQDLPDAPRRTLDARILRAQPR
ncbi:MAG TPA: hypothetical protein PLG92_16460, partial [Piscinibacter sp.]|nr:hypothetical protein [Piscinibacter sp.]